MIFCSKGSNPEHFLRLLGKEVILGKCFICPTMKILFGVVDGKAAGCLENTRGLFVSFILPHPRSTSI